MSVGDGMPPRDTADKSLGDIVTEVSEKASLLVREEIELAKAEVTDKVSKLTKGAVIGIAAGVFLLYGFGMLFEMLAWFFVDLFDWSSVWFGFAVVTGMLFVLAVLAALLARRLFQMGAPPTPDLAIEEARRTRAELESQTIERDQLDRSLERGEETRT